MASPPRFPSPRCLGRSGCAMRPTRRSGTTVRTGLCRNWILWSNASQVASGRSLWSPACRVSVLTKTLHPNTSTEYSLKGATSLVLDDTWSVDSLAWQPAFAINEDRDQPSFVSWIKLTSLLFSVSPSSSPSNGRRPGDLTSSPARGGHGRHGGQGHGHRESSSSVLGH